MTDHSALRTPHSALLYGRVSTGLQATDTQEVRGKDYLQWKQLSLAAEFYDDDISGSIAIWDRPEGRKLPRLLESSNTPTLQHSITPIRDLVVVKLDRLGRSAIDLLKTIELLDSLGVILHMGSILHMRALRDQGTSYDRIARDLNARAVPTKRGKGTIMRLRISDASHAPDAPRSTSKLVSGRWQAGNVAKLLNSKTVQAWLAARTRRTVSLAVSA